MREISTKTLEIGEHIIVDGVEYVTKEAAGDCQDCDFRNCGRCFLIPCRNGVKLKLVDKQPADEHDKDTPMTNLQLAEWLAKGCGLWKYSPSNSGTVYYAYWVIEGKEGCFVEDNILIRPWGTDEWVRPTVGIYERDCRK